jgi:tetratricopeptide (TPR) repeat protein
LPITDQLNEELPVKPETTDRKLVVEQAKRFSESMLWKIQREYFDREGINAWVNQVPFYITSNPFIASAYAQVVFAFICDWVKQHPDSKNHPFYMMELGTGSGRFSYYFVKRLTDLLHSNKMSHIKICYIMSDFTKHNIQYHETHPALKPYIDQGIVDFALYDLEAEKPLTLLKQNIRLSPEVLVNPLTVFANYVFDTITHDSFMVHNEKIYELLVSLSTEESNLEGAKPIDMEKVTVDHSVHEAKAHYYNDPHIDSVLEMYRKSLNDTSFLIPISSIRAIRFLRKLANDKLLILSTDKGYSSLESLENLGHPSIAFHGSFSMMVNFHALSEYLKNSGGDSFLQTPRKGIKTSIFCSGFQLKDLPETSQAIEKNIEEFSPSDYFNLHRRISDSFQECEIDTLSSHLALSGWDPHIYARISSRIISLIPESDSDAITFLAHNMPKMAENYYFMPKSDCILFEIAVFYHAIKRYDEALKYYLQAKEYIGEQFGLVYNVALCRHLLKDNTGALEDFKHALTLDPTSDDAKEWVAYVEKEIAEGSSSPSTEA